MKKVKIVLLLVFISCLGLHNAGGQVNVSYHFSDLGQKIGVGYTLKPFNKLLTIDGYLYGAAYLEELSPEFTIRANFVNKDRYKLYAGTGFITNNFFSWVFPVGVEVVPFDTFPKLSLKFDVNLMFEIDRIDSLAEPVAFASGLGICYRFGK
jgi:hypothetical protein